MISKINSIQKKIKENNHALELAKEDGAILIYLFKYCVLMSLSLVCFLFFYSEVDNMFNFVFSKENFISELKIYNQLPFSTVLSEGEWTNYFFNLFGKYYSKEANLFLSEYYYICYLISITAIVSGFASLLLGSFIKNRTKTTAHTFEDYSNSGSFFIIGVSTTSLFISLAASHIFFFDILIFSFLVFISIVLFSTVFMFNVLRRHFVIKNKNIFQKQKIRDFINSKNIEQIKKDAFPLL